MPFTKDDLAALDAAILSGATGAIKVKFADKEVTYRTMDELIKARALVAKEVGAAQIAGSGQINPVTSKGFNRR